FVSTVTVGLVPAMPLLYPLRMAMCAGVVILRVALPSHIVLLRIADHLMYARKGSAGTVLVDVYLMLVPTVVSKTAADGQLERLVTNCRLLLTPFRPLC